MEPNPLPPPKAPKGEGAGAATLGAVKTIGLEDDPKENVGAVALPGGLIFKKELPKAPEAGCG